LHGSCASSISLSLCIVSRGWRVPAIPNCCAGFCVCPPKKHVLSRAHTHRFEVTSVDSKNNRIVDFISFLYQPLFVLSHGPRSEQFLLLTRSYAATGLSDLSTRWGALVGKVRSSSVYVGILAPRTAGPCVSPCMTQRNGSIGPMDVFAVSSFMFFSLQCLCSVTSGIQHLHGLPRRSPPVVAGRALVRYRRFRDRRAGRSFLVSPCLM
jgi:hypothetical protein